MGRPSHAAAVPSENDSGAEELTASGEEAEAAPANKRQRTSVSLYPKGTVKQVKVLNFMTYGEPAVTITPGPRLNLVLGPNGTGKSSLVCALCVGLAGSTKLLGRADNTKDYIRRGCDRGYVETTLSGGPGAEDYVVRCDLIKSADTYKTEWKLNRVSRTKKDIQELVKSLNIQFDNLCQFLPQDKVVEFARMDQYELLVATEKAIGDATLYDTHQKLIERRNATKDVEATLASTERRHEQLLAENQRLERDYERFTRRKQLQDRIVMMMKKKAWMAVKETQEKANEAAQQHKQAQEALKLAQQEAQADERPAQRRRQEADTAKSAASEIAQEVRKLEREAKAASDKLQDLDNDIQANRQKINGLQEKSNKRLAEIDACKQQREQLTHNLNELPPPPDHTARQAELAQQMQDIREQVSRLEADRIELTHSIHAARMEISRQQGALRECESAKYQRLQAMIKKHKGMDDLEGAMQWVSQQKQQGAFKGEVAGPLGLDMKIKIARCAAYLEQATFSQLCNFAVQYKEDADILSNKFKELNLRCNVITIADDINQPLMGNSAHLNEYGVICSLDDVYDAPPLVKHCLANMCNLPKVFVVDHDDTDRVRRLMEEQGVQQVYTPQRRVNYIHSRYGSREDASLQTAFLQKGAGSILGGGAVADVEQRKQDLQRTLQAKHEQLQHLEQQDKTKADEIHPLNQQLEQLQADRQRLGQEVEQARQKRSRLQSNLKQLNSLLTKRESQPDPLEEAPGLQRQVTKAINEHFKTLCKQLSATETLWAELERLVVADMTWRELDMQAKGMAAAISARKAALQSLEAAARQAQMRSQTLKQVYLRAKREAEEEHPLDNEVRQRFQQMPDGMEELEETIQKLQEEVAGISVNNPRVLEEYRKRQQEIQKLADELQSLNSNLESARAEIDMLKESWQPELERVVALINNSFSTNFAHIGCAGEVLLGTSTDYDKFSIQIKVKFREGEDLQLLTAHRQSGGERSVSTILYLIALQGVTVTPFRVVDEINQGMDPVNERKVFMQLVEASCQESTPQCFLLTPKLLPDLPFTEDITVLNIFNGGLIAEQVAGHYSSESLFGTRALASLQRVRVAG